MNCKTTGGMTRMFVGGLALLAVACSGQVNVGEDADAGAAGAGSDSMDPDTETDTDTDTETDSAHTWGLDENELANSCPSACSDPAGTVVSLATVEAFFDNIVGRWRICSGGEGAFLTLPGDAAGVEYAPPEIVDAGYATIWRGPMYFLVEGED